MAKFIITREWPSLKECCNTPEDIIDRYFHHKEERICNILDTAFRKHFGYSITEVRDMCNLLHITSEYDGIESFIYRGETFLYLKIGEPEYKRTQEFITISNNVMYKEV